MSYIAKIYLNKMFPKKGDDAIHLEGDEIIFPMVNVINPIEANDVPDEINNYFEIIINGKPLAGKNAPADVFEKMKMELVNGGKTFTSENYKESKGMVLPVGEKVRFRFPNHLGLEAGAMLKIEVKIHQDTPLSFRIQRKLL